MQKIYPHFCFSFFPFQNFSTADRPRCMIENYPRQSRRNRYYGSDDYEETNWYWNMNHQPNGSPQNIAKKSHQKSKNANYYPSSRSSQSNSSSGFQSFFRWFKKDEKSRVVNDIRYPREVTSSSDTLDFDNDRRFTKNGRRKLKAYDSNETLSPPQSPRLSRAFAQSSSCDSVFSSASSFAYVPPTKYLSNRNQKQVRMI
jgi:hypothetical protein